MPEPNPLMRLPALHMLEAPTTNASLLQAAEADYHRDSKANTYAHRRQARLACSPHAHAEVHRRLSGFLGAAADDTTESDETEKEDEEDDSDDADADADVERKEEYSRLMHAHTKYQLASPSSSTLPSYQTTMHAFTLNQLNAHRNLPGEPGVSLSAPSTSPSQTPLVPSRLHLELGRLSLDEVPPGPSNTPEQGARDVQQEAGIDFRKLSQKRRSITEPLPRQFVAAAVKARDFAAA